VISKTVLVLAEDFGRDLGAERVASALARGLEADDKLRCDQCALATADPNELQEYAFDARMRAARALVIATPHLNDSTLAGSVTFEAATRARQSGVPAYAVTARDGLDPFEARIVDLQVVLKATDSRSLGAAGRRLSALV
jgi:hypothetical protein